MDKKQMGAMQYEKPTVVDYGELIKLTAASGSMNHLDHAFPTNTPFSALTFS